MRNKVTTEDLIAQLPYESAERVRENIRKNIEKWGGKRQNAGRKPKTGVVLEFRMRVSEKEKEFLDYARSHNLNYDELMQG